jgi:hypothetical protein
VTIDQITESDDDLDALFEQGDEDEERSSGYRERPWWWLKTEGDVAVLRFLEESSDWRKVPTHKFFPTKPEPSDNEGKWPEQMPATCRAGRLSGKFPQGCAIDNSGYEGKFKKGSKAEDVRYTIAVEREQYEENGRKKYRDKEVEVPVFDQETGAVSETETITLPSLVLVGETMWRMMSGLKGVSEALGSLVGQDIRLKLIKNPSGQGSIVSAIAVGDNGVVPGSEHWEGYQFAQKLWKPGGLVLNREILYRASDEYWKHFFLMEDGRTWKQHDIERGGDKTSHTPAKSSSSGGSSSGGGSQSATTTAQPDADKLAKMRARIQGN